IAHLHLKDVDPSVLARVRSQELTVEEAWEQGLFCEFGTGAVDFSAVLGELDGFSGWAVVEQDRVAVQVADLPEVRAVEERNLAAIRAWGGGESSSRSSRRSSRRGCPSRRLQSSSTRAMIA